MMQIKTFSRKVMWICLLFALFGAGNVQAQGIDFTVLNDDDPKQSLSQTEGYKNALRVEKTWNAVSSDKKLAYWDGTYADESFKLNIMTLNLSKTTDTFKAYLVSPALSLKAIGGKKLNYGWKLGSPKGTCKMSVILIDKQGNELGKIDEISTTEHSSEFTKRTASIPTVDAEKGFIAFVCEGEKANRGYFEVQNIETGEATASPTLEVDQTALDFGSLKVGQESEKQVINVTIENYNGGSIKPILEGDAYDFSVETETPEGLTQKGGKITVAFKPTAKGKKNAAIKIIVGDQTQTVTLSGEAIEEVEEEKPQVELLEDGFFWEFKKNMPTYWEAVGARVKKLTESDTYRNDGGFAVGIITEGQKGYLRQIIDLKKAGKEVTAGDEVECTMKYKTVASPDGKATLRLAMRWTDDAGTLIECAEKNFVDNPNIFFGKMLAWGDLKFRTTCPDGATKLEFKVEVLENCEVAFDEFTAERIPQSYAQAHPLVAILPQVTTIYGRVGVPAVYDIAIQSRNMAAAKPNFSGGGATVLADKVLKLDIEELPTNSSIASKLTVTPTKKGAYTASNAFSVSFAGGDPALSSGLTLISYFMDKDNKPTLKLGEGVQVREMRADKGKTDSQSFTFTVEHEITDVYVKIEQDPLHAYFKNTKSGYYYYSSKSEKIIGTPEINITFTPLEAGTFKAKVLVTTICGETLEIPLVGVCEEANTAIRTEKFSEAPKGDARFDGRKEWEGFGSYDLGWWHIDGKWNAASDVTLSKSGELYFDELLENGLITMKMSPKESAAKCIAEYSLDGGGHWKSLEAADSEGEFKVNTIRPTLIRFVNKSDNDIKVNMVAFNPNPVEKRQNLDKIEDAIFINADAEPLAKLDENFDNRRHTRILSIPGWQNFATMGDIPFRIWHQKADLEVSSPVESEGAYITFFKWGQEDERFHEAWLISPTLSYQKAASKILTFRTRFSGLSMEQRKQSFDAYIITENGGQAQVYYLDLRKYAPFGVVIEENEKEWLDYRIDLEALRSEFPIEDKFHIAFTQWAEHGGNFSNLVWMVDNVTFGRTDLPKITVDKEFFSFPFRKDVETEEMSFNITTENANYPVSVTLVPGRMKSYFKLKTPGKLLSTGGTATFTYKASDDSQRAAAYLIQTPGAEPVMVKLLATFITGIDGVNAGNGSLQPVVTENGIAMGGQYKSYHLYNAAGQLLKQGGYEPTISITGLQRGIVVLKVITDEGVKTFKLSNK
ncbi:choice-of-anchor J domain-containing protein [Prevotella sp. HUN102]|uniref:choice-of-anchor J domain-containing protein n=1 Tax=Prevotella sp. HUN102 TaxID=1392486 RepID=UPI00049013D8|nr:choice-of-anchor J domain-containing protein [Prevotella sp. HUN102]